MDAIVERHLIAPMRDAIKLLADLVAEWTSAGTIPEVDWARMRSLEFQEVLRARDELVERLKQRACILCGDFENHVSPTCLCHYMALTYRNAVRYYPRRKVDESHHREP